MRRRIRESRATRAGLVNAFSGVADYISQPLALLLATPFLLHRLGPAQYGLWMITNAAIGSSGLLSTGFSDMALKYAAMHRGRNDWIAVVRVVQSSITINLAIGSIMALLLWTVAPFAGIHVFRLAPELQTTFVQALRIGSATLLIRSLDSILVNLLRAYEKYWPAAQITISSRAAIVVSAVVLVGLGRGVVSIMVATLAIGIMALLAQGYMVSRYVGRVSFIPAWHPEVLAAICPFGCFSWIQALSGIVFGQSDRLIVGAILGSSAVAYYSVCTQAAQSVHGLAASSFHFLFPRLSTRHATVSSAELSHSVKHAFLINVLVVALLCLPMALLSKPILSFWIGKPFAATVWPILSVTAIGFGLVGMNVTAHYTLMALGAIRYVTFVNVAAGLIMTAIMVVLISHFGLIGAAVGRLVYGPVTWLAYLKVRSLLRPRNRPPLLEPALTGI
jgi:O-antigen/teichoic acid export membrane protein